MTRSASSKNLGNLEWLTALKRLAGAKTPAVLVTLASAKGSTPREAGTKMVVTAEDFYGTIGGGHLEYRCLEIARGILADKPDGRVRRREAFPLGPALGQCCGGAAEVLFEAVAEEDIERLALGGASHSLLVTPLAAQGGAMYLRTPLTEDEVAGSPRIAMEAGCEVLIEPIGDMRPQVFLFGAGHVGQALVTALAPLPFAVTWVDSRVDIFPARTPANVQLKVADTPALEVAQAQPDALYLVMTHSHQLDLEICETVLNRGDFAYLGLIGSATKRTRFERRLRVKGISRPDVNRLTCPIGVAGISGKHPAEIAASVSAQLLVVWEQHRAARDHETEDKTALKRKSMRPGP